MTLDPQLRDELAAIEEPQLVRSLDELGFLGEVTEDEGQIRVELVLPVTNWPHLETLREAVLAKAPGAEVVVRTMNDEGRLALRHFLRGAMSAPSEHAGHGHESASPESQVLGPAVQDSGAGHLFGQGGSG